VESQGEEEKQVEEKPDYEAEEVSPKKINKLETKVDKKNLFKPVREVERERLEEAAVNYSPDGFIGVEDAADGKSVAGKSLAGKSAKSRKKKKKKGKKKKAA
jgi:hypothetical protein